MVELESHFQKTILIQFRFSYYFCILVFQFQKQRDELMGIPRQREERLVTCIRERSRVRIYLAGHPSVHVVDYSCNPYKVILNHLTHIL